MSQRHTGPLRRRPEVLGCLLVLSLIGSPLRAGELPADSVSSRREDTPWSFSAQGYYYSIPDDDNFLIAIGSADRGSLHLEGRYNYEDLKTGSLFAGWTIATGESFTAEFTPMLGAAFGQTNGIVPALEVSLGRGLFDFYSETEYLIDLEDEEGNYLYTWLELAVSPHELLRLGLAAQRTRVAGTPLELERGLFAQATPEFGSIGLYAFNLFTEYWFLIVGVEIAW